MHCHFCCIEKATHWRVPTVYGLVDGLCAACYAEHARIPKRPKSSTERQSMRAKRGPVQLLLSFQNEAGGQVTAARSDVSTQ